MTSTRRDLLKLLPALGWTAATPLSADALGSDPRLPITASSAEITLQPEPKGSLAPLDHIRVESPHEGRLIVRDGGAHVYHEADFHHSAEFTIGGGLGTHTVSLLSASGQLAGQRSFEVDCRTEVEDEGGAFRSLLKSLYFTMANDAPMGTQRFEGKPFHYWVDWLLDNTMTLKGMKYFSPEVKSNVEFYGRSQREDGMVWENIVECTPPQMYWERVFDYGGFTRKVNDGFLLLRRAPVENHVEGVFLEAIYYAWKASGDTPWMEGMLDHAIRAIHYSTSDPYRWSTKYRLLKRGFTIDMWDFLCDSEADLTSNIMVIDLKKTHFGVFYGDNTHMIAGMRHLAEMLDYVHRSSQAPEFRQMADAMEKRLNALCWNGEFFTQWVPEDPDFKPDMGVDTGRQVTLSNAYSLNRGISDEKCAAIIQTYQRIRKEMPSTSPGEFYSVYPPYERGFTKEHMAIWNYVNGGVLSCTAGELARGAFEHGFEEYGADILRREKQVADRHQGYMPGIIRGKLAEPPPRTFHSVDMRAIVNAAFDGGAPGVPGWIGEPGNDLAAMPTGKQTFRDVPFEVIDPASNGKRTCLIVSSAEGYRSKARLPLDAPARSFYLLHAASGGAPIGKLTLRYADGSSFSEYMQDGKNIGSWWEPKDGEWDYQYGPQDAVHMQVAWRGANSKGKNLGVYVVGFENPHPDKELAALEFEALDNGVKWMVLAVTLSDAPVFLPYWTDVSTGMPNDWGAGALVFALIEGLAGVKDTGVALDRASVAPRWTAAGVNGVKVSVRYPASRGYVRYLYSYDPGAKTISCQFSGSAKEMDWMILLPEGGAVKQASIDGSPARAEQVTVRTSRYARVQVAARGAHTLNLELA